MRRVPVPGRRPGAPAAAAWQRERERRAGPPAPPLAAARAQPAPTPARAPPAAPRPKPRGLPPRPASNPRPLLRTQIFGPESSGKTTLALHAIAEVQKAGGMAVFIDAEHAFDQSYAKVSGCGCGLGGGVRETTSVCVCVCVGGWGGASGWGGTYVGLCALVRARPCRGVGFLSMQSSRAQMRKRVVGQAHAKVCAGAAVAVAWCFFFRLACVWTAVAKVGVGGRGRVGPQRHTLTIHSPLRPRPPRLHPPPPPTRTTRPPPPPPTHTHAEAGHRHVGAAGVPARSRRDGLQHPRRAGGRGARMSDFSRFAPDVARFSCTRGGLACRGPGGCRAALLRGRRARLRRAAWAPGGVGGGAWAAR